MSRLSLVVCFAACLTVAFTQGCRGIGSAKSAKVRSDTPASLGMPVGTQAVAVVHKACDTISIDLGGGVKMEMVYVPPGEFLVGSPGSDEWRYDDETQHRVTLTKGFWMGKYEVTQEQWERVMGNKPSNFKGARNPVEKVMWTDCQEFIKKLNQRVAGGRFRLPTEAEWEYACRAGTKTRFHAGDDDSDLGEAGWFDGNSGSKTHPVGEKIANAFCLYDMHGNVWEWCQDWYGKAFSDPYGAAVSDPVGPAAGGYRVYRGGGWPSDFRYCRSAHRDGSEPRCRKASLGLRILRTTDSMP